jgi:Tol biopolymer transport system component
MQSRTISRAVLLAAVAGLVAAPVGATADETAPGKNGRIAFTRYVDADRTTGSIYVVQPDGKGERRVTRAPAGARDAQADWAPSGDLIFFERQWDNRPWEAYRVRPDGSGLTELDPGCPKGSFICEVAGPAVSPDGRRIAFSHGYGKLKVVDGEQWIEVGAISVMNSGGTGARQLTQRTKPTSSEDKEPVWSPDGKRIAFIRLNSTADPRGQQAIFVMNADGSGVRRVTPWAMKAGDHPDWSPDGKWIIFRSPEPGGLAGTDLFRVHPDGTGLQRLTNTGPNIEMLSASYSPDGKSIVYASTGRGGLPDLFSMSRDGKAVRPITRTSVWDSGPDWGPR